MRKIYFLILLLAAFAGYAAPPVIQEPSPLKACDNNNDGIATFNLTTVILEVLGSLNANSYTVTFHETFDDAQLGGTTIPIPTSYTNITLTPQTIYIKVRDNATMEFSITTLDLIVAALPTPGEPADLTRPTDGTAYAPFDFTDNFAALYNGRSHTEIGLSFFTTLERAESNTNPIDNLIIVSYSSTNGTRIWVRVTDVATGCYVIKDFGLFITGTDYVFIPDFNFKAKLLAANTTNNYAYNLSNSPMVVDSNGDGEIQYTEALQVSALNVFGSDIADLTGIGSFTNLTSFVCSQNPITSLNTAGLTNLTTLTCGSTNINQLLVNESVNLTSLNCGVTELNSLDVSQLINLTELFVQSTGLTSLDVSALVNLQKLFISNTQINNIDLSNNVNLLEFYASSARLSSLDLTNSPNLQKLSLRSNLLTSLDVSGLTSLNFLDCYSNPLPILDLSTLSALVTLDAQSCQLSTVNLSNSPLLQLVLLSENLLTELDFSNNPAIVNFGVRGNPNLVSVNLKNGGIGSGFDFTDCPDLRFICADEGEITAITNSNAASGVTGVVVNSYCSFTPGGDFNTILASVSYDDNNNGCDAGDALLPSMRININDGTNSGAVFTEANGTAKIYTQAGNFDLSLSVENPSWFTISPLTVAIPFANTNNNTATQNFCMRTNGVHPDLEIVIAPLNDARPGFDAQYRIAFKNKGNQMISMSDSITFVFDPQKTDFISSTQVPRISSPGIIKWDIDTLYPFDYRNIDVTMRVHSPLDPNPVNNGDVLEYGVSVNLTGEETPEDNAFQYRQTVVGSFDPNNIVCLEGNIVSPSQIGNYLHYMINFENTGTAQAENIVVREVVDPAQFDMASLQLLHSSASVTTRLRGNIAEFIFPNINLHSGGHGNILLKIKSKDNLLEGDSVSKKANIYFDYNFPVETLPENTVFQALSNPDIPTDASISVYPNPNKGILNIKCDSMIRSVQLFDVQGRLLQTNLTEGNQEAVDISAQSSGVYFLKIVSEKGIGIKKIVRE